MRKQIYPQVLHNSESARIENGPQNIPLINRCPVEILVAIFESTLPPPSTSSSKQYGPYDPHWQATQVSHVCRFWRTLALDSPALWTDIYIDFGRQTIDIKSYWERAVSRIRRAPAIVHFLSIGSSTSHIWTTEDRTAQIAAIDACNLTRIQNVFHLTLTFSDSVPSRSIPGIARHIKGIPLKSLEIGGVFLDEIASAYDPWDWDTLLQRFGPRSLQSLVLRRTGKFKICSEPSSTLKRLLIEQVELDLQRLATLCPNLEHLEARECLDVTGSSSQPIHFLHLLSLALVGNDLFPWQVMRCPSLASFRFEDVDMTDMSNEVIAFLKENPSVKKLHLSQIDPRLSELAAVSPQVTELTLNTSWPGVTALAEGEAIGMPEPCFPLLENLELSLIRPDDIKLEEFEALVQWRCLPSSHPASKLHGAKPLNKLVISAVGNWRSSAFLKHATLFEEDECSEMVSLSWIVT